MRGRRGMRLRSRWRKRIWDEEKNEVMEEEKGYRVGEEIFEDVKDKIG